MIYKKVHISKKPYTLISVVPYLVLYCTDSLLVVISCSQLPSKVGHVDLRCMRSTIRDLHLRST